jgi:mono/diheme cytochrome c family protein
MAGTLVLPQRCCRGLEIRNQHLWLDPTLPDELKCLSVRMRFRGQTVEVEITADLVTWLRAFSWGGLVATPTSICRPLQRGDHRRFASTEVTASRYQDTVAGGKPAFLIPSSEGKTMPKKTRRLLLISLMAAGCAAGAASSWCATIEKDTAMIERGRYLAQVAGCNDCHTSGYLMSNGRIPESRWLLGDSFGWRGPWGTTYPSNLRLFLKGMSEDQWVQVARTLKRRPPMPWYTLNMMHEDDLRALYRFIRSLGDPGKPAPAYVPPDQEPSPPYALFPSPPKSRTSK